MRIRDGAERRLGCRSAVELKARGADERRVVLGCDLHEQIVRMLPIVDLLAATELARCEQIRITTATDRPRLEADHATQRKMAAPGTALCHPHQPVDASGLVGAALVRFVQVLQEGVLVRHQHPRTLLTMQHVHRRRVRAPARARTVARHAAYVTDCVYICGLHGLVLVLTRRCFICS